jgi:hypothetical protein
VDVVEALRQIEDSLGELELLKATTVAKRVGEMLNISAGAARKRLEKAVAAGAVIEPRLWPERRRVLLPGGNDLPALWVLGMKNREEQGYRLVRKAPEGWRGLGGVSFLLSAPRCAELVATVQAKADEDRKKHQAEAAAREAKRQAEADAEQREEDALFDQLFPSLSEALEHLRSAGSDRLKIGKSAMVIEGRGSRGRLHIEFPSKDFPLLEGALRKEFGLSDAMSSEGAE